MKTLMAIGLLGIGCLAIVVGSLACLHGIINEFTAVVTIIDGFFITGAGVICLLHNA